MALDFAHPLERLSEVDQPKEEEGSVQAIIVALDQDVLWLEIQVHNAKISQESQPRSCLVQKVEFRGEGEHAIKCRTVGVERFLRTELHK